MHRSTTSPLLVMAFAFVALVAAACSTAAGSASPPASSTSAPASGGTTRVEVTLTDALRIEPAAIVVPAGVPVTFVVTNAGAADHEFYLGDEAAQQAHGEEMMGGGGMVHDEPMGIGVEPGETKELVVTFEVPGALLAGCHVAGHYEAGMQSTVTVGEG